MVLAACGSTGTVDTTAQGGATTSTTAGAASTTQPPEPVEPITVTYYVGGLTTPGAYDFAAQAEGFFEDENIIVETVILDGTSQAVQAMAAHRNGLAFVTGSLLDIMLIADANADAPPLRAIAASATLNPVAVMFLEGGEISEPADLVGKTIAVPTGSLSASYLNVFLESEGIALDDVEILNIGFGALNPALLQGQVDAIVAFSRGIASLSIVAAEQEKTVDFFLLADYGIASPMTSTVVQQRLIDEFPEVARGIAAASTRGLYFCAVDPEGCIRHFLEVADGRDFDQSLAEWNLALRTQYGIDAASVEGVDPLTLGWFDPDTVAKAVPELRDLFGIASEFDPLDLYTNDYVKQP